MAVTVVALLKALRILGSTTFVITLAFKILFSPFGRRCFKIYAYYIRAMSVYGVKREKKLCAQKMPLQQLSQSAQCT